MFNLPVRDYLFLLHSQRFFKYPASNLSTHWVGKYVFPTAEILLADVFKKVHLSQMFRTVYNCCKHCLEY